MEGHLLLEHPLGLQCDWLCLCHYCSAERPQSWVSCGRRVSAHEDAMPVGDKPSGQLQVLSQSQGERSPLLSSILPARAVSAAQRHLPPSPKSHYGVLFPSVAPLSWIVVQQLWTPVLEMAFFPLLFVCPPAPALFCYLGKLKAGQSLVSRVLEHRMGHTMCGSLPSADVWSYL